MYYHAGLGQQTPLTERNYVPYIMLLNTHVGLMQMKQLPRTLYARYT